MNEPRRILHVHSGNMYGGIESILVTLARHGRNLLEQTFALCYRERLAGELNQCSATTRILEPVRLRNPWSVLRARSRLREVLRTTPVDAAIVHSAWSRRIFGPVLRDTVPKLVLWQHSAGERDHWLDRAARRVPVDLVLCNSRFTERRHSNREPSSRTEVLYPPVPPPNKQLDRAALRGAFRSELEIDDATVLLLQAGRIESGKGVAVHLEAAATLLDLPDWQMVHVGSATHDRERRYLAELHREVERLGLEQRVTCLEERDDMDAVYAGADVYCQPCVLPESFGITYVEAMYAGLPVVASDIGAAPEIVTSDTGVMVPADDAGALSAALRTLIRDAGMRAELGRNGPGRASTLCGPPAIVARLSGILSERRT